MQNIAGNSGVASYDCIHLPLLSSISLELLQAASGPTWRAQSQQCVGFERSKSSPTVVLHSEALLWKNSNKKGQGQF